MSRISFLNGWSAEFDQNGETVPGSSEGKILELVREVDGKDTQLFWMSMDELCAAFPAVRVEINRELRLDEPYTRIWTVPGVRMRVMAELEELTTDGRWVVTSRWH
ncbi:hypothetical protein [Nocardia jiangxiensis]|uniref:hypothetical protein n=1 Tax=Nocardia jiangxiensis TaxID=282685 RepID=UPI00030C177F|nr:hypothetical protein [Nocardia jiangxiensis]